MHVVFSRVRKQDVAGVCVLASSFAIAHEAGRRHREAYIARVEPTTMDPALCALASHPWIGQWQDDVATVVSSVTLSMPDRFVDVLSDIESERPHYRNGFFQPYQWLVPKPHIQQQYDEQVRKHPPPPMSPPEVDSMRWPLYAIVGYPWIAAYRRGVSRTTTRGRRRRPPSLIQVGPCIPDVHEIVCGGPVENTGRCL